MVRKEEVDQRSGRGAAGAELRGSATGLFVNLLESDAVPAADIEALEKMIREYKKRKKSAAG